MQSIVYQFKNEKYLRDRFYFLISTKLRFYFCKLNIRTGIRNDFRKVSMALKVQCSSLRTESYTCDAVKFEGFESRRSNQGHTQGTLKYGQIG